MAIFDWHNIFRTLLVLSPLIFLGAIGMARYSVPYYNYYFVAAGIWMLGALAKLVMIEIERRERRRIQNITLTAKEQAVINMSTD